MAAPVPKKRKNGLEDGFVAVSTAPLNFKCFNFTHICHDKLAGKVPQKLIYVTSSLRKLKF